MSTEPITLAFVDCETTGLRPDLGHTIWELAVIVRRPGDDWDAEHVWQIRPDLTTADPEALKVNDFHRRFKVPDGVEVLWFPQEQREPVPQTFGETATQVRGILDGVYLVGAVPAFDAMMLAHLLRSHGHEPKWRHRLVCVENLVAGAACEPVPQGLRHAASVAGVWVDPDVRHTAMGDARTARDVYDAVTCHRSPDEHVSASDHIAVSRADLVAYLNRGTGDVAVEVAALNRLLAAAGIE